MSEKYKLVPNSLISEYNCSNCESLEQCEDKDVEFVDYQKPGVTLAHYWCWAHSYFGVGKRKLKLIKETIEWRNRESEVPE